MYRYDAKKSVYKTRTEEEVAVEFVPDDAPSYMPVFLVPQCRHFALPDRVVDAS